MTSHDVDMCTAAGPQGIYSGAAAPGVDEYGTIPAIHYSGANSRSGVHAMPTWGGSCGGAARGGHQRRGHGHLQPHPWATVDTVSAEAHGMADSHKNHVVLPDDIPGSSLQLQEEAQVLSSSHIAGTRIACQYQHCSW